MSKRTKAEGIEMDDMLKIDEWATAEDKAFLYVTHWRKYGGVRATQFKQLPNDLLRNPDFLSATEMQKYSWLMALLIADEGGRIPYVPAYLIATVGEHFDIDFLLSIQVITYDNPYKDLKKAIKKGEILSTSPLLLSTLISSNLNSSTNRKLLGELDQGFDDFWKAYPKRQNKPAAQKAWRKAKCHEKLDTILKAVKQWSKTEQWQDKQYIPLASTWINGERWDDEIPSPKETPEEKSRRELLDRVMSYR